MPRIRVPVHYEVLRVIEVEYQEGDSIEDIEKKAIRQLPLQESEGISVDSEEVIWEFITSENLNNPEAKVSFPELFLEEGFSNE
ncbi:hypothetical protein [Chroococcidiopsis sp.]|uniref:hypothetical protein n=1 Tax=Chroococcidiopsis sp. TaxID=3088168 RepID=UPI003F2F8951